MMFLEARSSELVTMKKLSVSRGGDKDCGGRTDQIPWQNGYDARRRNGSVAEDLRANGTESTCGE